MTSSITASLGANHSAVDRLEQVAFFGEDSVDPRTRDAQFGGESGARDLFALAFHQRHRLARKAATQFVDLVLAHAMRAPHSSCA